jgi:tight adherence protein B
MDPLIIGIAATIFFAFILIAVGLTGRGQKDDPMSSRLEAFRSAGPLPQSTASPGKASFREKRSYSGLPVLSAFLSQFRGSEAMAIHLERAAVPLRVGEFYLIRWGMAALFLVIPFVFGFALFNLLLGIGLAVVGYMLPAMWVNSKKKGRISKINQQLVDLLGLVSNSLKSGYGLMQSFEFASRQMQPPIALEIRRMLRESNLGMSAEDALNALGERIDSADMDMVLTAINIQRTVGGNLAEILDKVTMTMRERERIRGEINTLTAQAKMTGIVIGGLPVFMFAIFMVMNPGYMSLLITETIGKAMLAAAIGLQLLGYFSMKRIMAIEI